MLLRTQESSQPIDRDLMALVFLKQMYIVVHFLHSCALFDEHGFEVELCSNIAVVY